MAALTDETTARGLLERALAMDTKPTLAVSDVDLLFQLATTEIDALPTWTATDLNRVAAIGWNWKAGLTSDKFDLGGGGGKYLKQGDWHTHCREMANAYATGQMGVLDGGTGSGGSGIESVAVISSTAAYADRWF